MPQRTMKGLRCDMNLTQPQMAERLGISVATYVAYENHRNKIPYSVALKFADVVKISNLRDIKFD
jgi:DNA-binding XRE family transcriptional regulator